MPITFLFMLEKAVVNFMIFPSIITETCDVLNSYIDSERGDRVELFPSNCYLRQNISDDRLVMKIVLLKASTENIGKLRNVRKKSF